MAGKEVGERRVVTFRVSPEVDSALQKAVAERGVTQSEVIQEALEARLLTKKDEREILTRMYSCILFMQEILVDMSPQPDEKLREAERAMREKAEELVRSLG